MASRLLKTLHETAKGLHKAGVMDKQTMHKFDALCLPPVRNYSSIEIKNLRERYGASQAVFAAYLNITVSTIQKWERGAKNPSGASLKLLNLVDERGLNILGSYTQAG